MKIERGVSVAIEDISPYPMNYNAHPAQQIAELRRSLQAFGQVRDIKGHPAMFPQELPEFAVKCWPGIVYDPFSGSGTTIIACERLGRKCRAVEIAPKYVAVAIESGRR